MKILVPIEMPKSCDCCPFEELNYDGEDVWCFLNERDNRENWDNSRPDWCPLNNCEVINNEN